MALQFIAASASIIKRNAVPYADILTAADKARLCNLSRKTPFIPRFTGLEQRRFFASSLVWRGVSYNDIAPTVRTIASVAEELASSTPTEEKSIGWVTPDEMSLYREPLYRLVGSFLSNQTDASEVICEASKDVDPSRLCQLALRRLCNMGSMVSAVSLIDLMRKQSTLTPAAYRTLIYGFKNRGDHLNAKAWMEIMINEGHMPDEVLINSVLTGLVQERKFTTAVELFERLISSGFVPATPTYDIAMRLYLRIGNLVRTLECIDTMILLEGTNMTMARRISIVRQLIELDHVDKADLFLTKLRDAGYPEDSALYDGAVRACIAAKKIEEALRYLKQMLSVETSSAQSIDGRRRAFTLLRVFAAAGEHGAANKVCAMMEEMGMKPNMAALLGWLDGCVESGNPDATRAVFDRAMACVAAGAHDPAHSKEWTSRLVWNQLLEAYANAKDFEMVRKTMENMTAGGIKPDHVSYTIAIDGHVEKGDIEGALKLFRHAAETIPPDNSNIGLWNVMLKGFARGGRVEDALRWMDTMRSSGLDPDSISYGTLIATLIKQSVSASRPVTERITPDGLVEASPGHTRPVLFDSRIMTLFEEARAAGKADINLYNVMIMGCVKANKLDDVRPWLDTIEHPASGVKPNVMTYDLVARAYAKLGKIRELRTIMTRAKKNGVDLDQSLFTLSSNAQTNNAKRHHSRRSPAAIGEDPSSSASRQSASSSAAYLSQPMDDMLSSRRQRTNGGESDSEQQQRKPRNNAYPSTRGGGHQQRRGSVGGNNSNVISDSIVSDGEVEVFR